MEFTLKINSSNEAMRTCEDVANALRKVAVRLRDRDWESWEEAIHDSNGNEVGSWELSGALVTCDDCGEVHEDGECPKDESESESESDTQQADPCADGHMFDFANADGRMVFKCVHCGRLA